MLTTEEVVPGKITLDIECVDRMYLNGYIKYLQIPGEVVNFIWTISVAWANPLSLKQDSVLPHFLSKPVSGLSLDRFLVPARPASYA